MTMLTAILSHLRAEQVHERQELLRAVAPDAEVVLCYGGPADEFERLQLEDKLFIDDPTLRGHVQHLQSLTVIFETLWRERFAEDDRLGALYLVEYDHLILDGRFEARLGELAERTGAALMGKNCVDRSATNEEHYIRFRRDRRLLAHLRRLSVREDPERIFGCLGTGIWLSRAGLEAYVAVGEHPPCYCEVYVPTLLHHLGFRVVDVDAHGDLYRDVRWLPTFDAAQVLKAHREDALFVHPVKDRDAVLALRRAILGSHAPPDGVGSSAGR